MSALPGWIKSQRKAAGLCERCGQKHAVTVYSGTGEELCWECLEIRRADARP